MDLKSLKNCVKLRSQVKIYIPSTVDVDRECENAEVVDDTLSFLSKLFGGATCSEALGAWMTSSGKLVKEKVTLCFAFCDQADLMREIDRVYEYCLTVKRDMAQEAIALEVNGELYFI